MKKTVNHILAAGLLALLSLASCTDEYRRKRLAGSRP